MDYVEWRFGIVLCVGIIKREKVRNEDIYLGNVDLVGINVVIEVIRGNR